MCMLSLDEHEKNSITLRPRLLYSLFVVAVINCIYLRLLALASHQLLIGVAPITQYTQM